MRPDAPDFRFAQCAPDPSHGAVVPAGDRLEPVRHRRLGVPAMVGRRLSDRLRRPASSQPPYAGACLRTSPSAPSSRMRPIGSSTSWRAWTSGPMRSRRPAARWRRSDARPCLPDKAPAPCTPAAESFTPPAPSPSSIHAHEVDSRSGAVLGALAGSPFRWDSNLTYGVQKLQVSPSGRFLWGCDLRLLQVPRPRQFFKLDPSGAVICLRRGSRHRTVDEPRR